QPAVFWANTGVIQTGRDGVRTHDLAVFIFHQISPVAMQHARTTFVQRRSMVVTIESPTTGFHAVHGDLSVFNVGMEQTNGIGTTTHTGNQCIRLTTKMLDTLTLHFTADHTLEITHQ